MKLHYECIEPVLAFGKDFAGMFCDDAFGDGKTKTVAVVHLTGFVASVETLEDVFQFLFGYGFTFVAY